MWPNSDEVQLLITRARGGDAAAEERLLELVRDPLRRLIAQRLNRAVTHREDASDVVQLVLIEVHHRLREFLKNPTMSFQLWVQLIARDHINDAHRRNVTAQKRSLKREQPAAATDRSSLDLVARLIDPERTPASEAACRELEHMMEAVLETLEADDRRIIHMRHHEKRSNQEVAEALGISEAAASMRHLRAIRRLQTLLKPD
jgi:RNA polymerase sigma-70 factor (ECF subfamily)